MFLFCSFKMNVSICDVQNFCNQPIFCGNLRFLGLKDTARRHAYTNVRLAPKLYGIRDEEGYKTRGPMPYLFRQQHSCLTEDP